MQAIYRILTPRERLAAVGVLALIITQGLVEAVGIGSVLPFLTLLADPQKALQEPRIQRVYQWIGASSLTDFTLTACVGLFAVFVAKNLFVILSDYVQARFCLGRQHRIASQLLESYLKRDYTFFLGANSSILLRHITNDVTAVCQGVLLYGLMLLSELVTCGFILALMFLTKPKLSLALLLGGAAVTGLLYLLIRNRSKRYGQVVHQTNDQIFKTTAEALAGVKDIKVLGLER